MCWRVVVEQQFYFPDVKPQDGHSPSSRPKSSRSDLRASASARGTTFAPRNPNSISPSNLNQIAAWILARRERCGRSSSAPKHASAEARPFRVTAAFSSNLSRPGTVQVVDPNLFHILSLRSQSKNNCCGTHGNQRNECSSMASVRICLPEALEGDSCDIDRTGKSGGSVVDQSPAKLKVPR